MLLARTVIFVVVFFVSTGIYVYDRHLASQGKAGPVSQLIDFVRFGKYAEDGGSTTKTRADEEPVDIHEHLLRLRDTYDSLYKERDDLVRKRQEILAELFTLNNQLLEEARTYAEVLAEEQYQFLSEFPELKEIAVQMARAYTEEDPVERTRLLLETEKRMEALFNLEAGESGSPEAQALKNHLSSLLTLIEERHPEQFQSFCQTADPDGCLSADPEQALELVQEVFRSGGQDLAAEINELKSIVESLTREYYITAENYTASEHLLEQRNQRVAGDLKKLSIKLVEVTDISVEEINALYTDLLFEYDVVLENLAFNLSRLEEKQKRLDWQLNHVKSTFPHKANNPAEDNLSPLAAIIKKQAELLSALEQNLVGIEDTYRHQRNLGSSLAMIVKENRRVSAQWIRAGATQPSSSVAANRVNRNEGVLDRARTARTADRASAASSPSRVMQQNNYSVRDTRAMLDNAAAVNKDIANRAKEQMQRLRDKARDQGFYDRAFPSQPR